MAEPAEGSSSNSDDLNPMGADHGLMDLKSESELKEQMVQRGFQFNFGCYEDANPEACHSLGQWLTMWMQQPQAGAQVFKHNCDQHNYAESCFKFANYLHYGANSSSSVRDQQKQAAAAAAVVDRVGSRRYYELGCRRLNHSGSCISLARLLQADGQQREGKELLQDTCLAKNSSIACMLAATDELRAKQLPEARRLAAAACDRGDAMGCDLLALMLQRGDGGAVDEAEAQRVRQRAKSMPSAYQAYLQQSRMRSRAASGAAAAAAAAAAAGSAA